MPPGNDRTPAPATTRGRDWLAPLPTEPVARYAPAIVAPLLALALRAALSPLLGEQAPTLIFVFAVVLAAWRGGFGPGILATGLSTALAAWFLIPPLGSFAIASTVNATRTVIFLVQGVAISLLGEAARRALRESEARAAALRVSEEKFRGLIESAPDAMVIADREGVIVLANAQTERLFGYARAELLGQHVEMLMPARFHARHTGHREGFVAAPRARAMGAGQDLLARRKDGSEFPVEISLSPLETGEGMFVSSAIRDVTARKQAEAVLEAERNRLRTLIDVLPVSIYVKDTASRFLVANEECARSLGTASPGDLLGKTDAEFFPPAIAAAFLEDEQKIMAGAPVVTLEEVSAYPDGSARTELTTKVPLRDGTGAIVGIVGVSRDITERKRAEEAVRASEELRRAFTDHTEDIIFVKDRESRTIFMNPAGLRANALPPEKVIGHTDAEFIRNPEQAARFLADDRRVLESQETLTVEEELTDASGGKRVLLTTKTPRFDAGGNVIGLVGIAHDITARKQAEEEIRQLNDELEERVRQRTAELEAVNKELETFSYSVAHDLRAPLRSIDGFSAAVLQDHGEKLDDEGREYLGFVRAGCQRMGHLIDDLLKLSRVTRAPLRHEPVNLTALAQRIAGDLRRHAPERVVECRIAEGLTTAGDPTLLEAALRNLLENAWKFTARRAEAVIEMGVVERANGQASHSAPVFFVRDNGAGFDMQYADKLFGVFQRLHRHEEFAGTGVGLATVQRILQRHGGRIWAEAALDKGVTFYFTLNEKGPH